MATRRRLSKNFTIEEFDCNDGTKVPRSHEAALAYLCQTILEPMRAKYGPCTVLSGFRTREYNQRIGGARYSFHVYNEHASHDVAVDVKFARGSARGWRWKAEQILLRRRRRKGGLGYYPNSGFIHIDTRDYPSRWTG